MKKLIPVTVEFTELEVEALRLVCAEEVRTIEQQIRYIIVDAMKARGLVNVEDLREYVKDPNATDIVELTKQVKNLVAINLQVVKERQASKPLLDKKKALPKPTPVEQPVEPETSKSTEIKPPERYYNKKESLTWKVWNFFSARPAKPYKRKEIVERLNITQQQLNSPLARLEKSGLITIRKEGVVGIYALSPNAREYVRKYNALKFEE